MIFLLLLPCWLTTRLGYLKSLTGCRRIKGAACSLLSAIVLHGGVTFTEFGSRRHIFLDRQDGSPYFEEIML